MNKDILKIYIDGSCRADKTSGIGVYAVHKENTILTLSEKVSARTNNQAEYMALLGALKGARILKFDFIEVYSDSKLVVEQVKGYWKINDRILQNLNQEAVSIGKQFSSFKITWIPRSKNEEANKLAQLSTER